MKKIIISLMVVIAVATVFVSIAQTPATAHKAMTNADLQWGDPPPGIPAGAKMAALHGDPAKPGPFTVRLNAPAGYIVNPHTHPTAERATVISGTFRIGMGEKIDEASMQEMGPGAYLVLPPGMAHYVKLKADCIVQIDSEGPFEIKYVNPADDPRNKESKK